MGNRRYGDSDTKLWLAQGLAMHKAELTAAMMFIGDWYTPGDSASWIAKEMHDGEPVPVHSLGPASPQRQAQAYEERPYLHTGTNG